MQDELAEESVGPGEPGAGEVSGVVFLEGLVQEMRSGSGVAQRAEAGADFLIVGAGEGAEENGHRPDVVEALVWSADALACSAAEEIWVVRTEHPGAGALVNGIVESAAAEVWKREQA